MDIKKFYPNVNNEILKMMLRRRIKDRDLLWLLDEIIDSAVGLPLGNYLSQQFANFYLTPFDRWIKEDKKVHRYYRYMDDMVIFSNNKQDLHAILHAIKRYLDENLKLQLKGNYQVFSVEIRGLDVIGYKLYHDYVLIRKYTKQRYIRMMVKNKNPISESSYLSWLKHCKSKNLIRTVNANCQTI